MSKTVQDLCKNGGLQVTFETLATLHQCALFEGEDDGTGDSASASLHWEVLHYGIPVVVASEDSVILCLADLESGDPICQFSISSSSQYVATESHFHVLAVSSGCFGISFADSAAGEKLLAVLKRVVPSVKTADTEEDDDSEPAPKQRIVADGVEEDGGIFHKKKHQEKPRLEISEPTHFQHLSHVGEDTMISELTKAMSWTDTLKRKSTIGEAHPSDIPMYNCKDVDTVSTTSFVQPPPTPPPGPAPPPAPGPPPPAAPPPPVVKAPAAKVVLKKKSATTQPEGSSNLMSSLADALKNGVVLRPVGSDRSSISSESSQRSYGSLQEELKNGVVLRPVGSDRSSISSESSQRSYGSLQEELKNGVVLRPVGSDRSSISSESSQRSYDSLQEELKNGVVLRPVGSDRSSISSESSQRSYDSLQEELKNGVVLKSTRNGAAMTLPMPPGRSQSDSLLFEIKTFRRNKLKHASTVSFCPDENSLESVMKRGLASMFKRMEVMKITNVGTVDRKGEDNLNGLFTDNNN